MKRIKKLLLITIFSCLWISSLPAQLVESEEQAERQESYEFLHRMWRGANFMAAKMDGKYHSDYDFKLLAKHHFTHCRIGGKLDLHTGEAPDYLVDADRLEDIREAVDLALANGIIPIVDPLHQYNEAYTDAELPKLKKIWEQVAGYLAGYSTDSVAFEIMNEPHDGINLKSAIHESLAGIRSVPGNEKRMVIVSGQGFSTRQALINALNDNIFPAGDSCLIGTYHYYDPRDFTRQGTTGIPLSWGEGGDQDPDWDEVSLAFDEVVQANMNWAKRNETVPLPLYLGEFGVDVVTADADRIRWHCWIRMQAEKRGHATAVWNMYTPDGSGKGIGPWNTEQKNDPSTRYFREDMVEALMTRYEIEEGTTNGNIGVGQVDPGYSGTGYADFSLATTNDSIVLGSIYIPRTSGYDLYMRYSNPGEEKAVILMKIYTNTGEPVSTVTLSGFLPEPPGGNWSMYRYKMELPADNDLKIEFIAGEGSGRLKLDYISITQGDYYDYSYPSDQLLTANAELRFPVQSGLKSEMLVYPVPFTHELQLVCTATGQVEINFQMMDMAGRAVEEGRLTTGQSVFIGQELPEGFYMVRFLSDRQQISRKVVKN